MPLNRDEKAPATPFLAASWTRAARPLRMWLVIACKLIWFCIRHHGSSGYIVVQPDGRIIGPVKG